MTTVIAQFDGQNFVPEQPVNVPVGTKVAIMLPAESPQNCSPQPHQFTPEEDADWERILTALRTGDPEFPTVEDAMRYIRRRP